MNVNKLINAYMKANKCSRSTAFRKYKRGEMTLNGTKVTPSVKNDTKVVSNDTKDDTKDDTSDTPVFTPNWKRAGYKSKNEALAQIVRDIARVAGDSRLMLGGNVFDLKKIRKV